MDACLFDRVQERSALPSIRCPSSEVVAGGPDILSGPAASAIPLPSHSGLQKLPETLSADRLKEGSQDSCVTSRTEPPTQDSAPDSLSTDEPASTKPSDPASSGQRPVAKNSGKGQEGGQFHSTPSLKITDTESSAVDEELLKNINVEDANPEASSSQEGRDEWLPLVEPLLDLPDPG